MNSPGGIPDARALLRSRLVLLLLAALFLGPLSLSFALYYGWHWRPAGQTNHGTLIQPPQSLPTTGSAAVLRGKWSLVYVGAGDCNADCRATLYFMRQTYLGLAQLMPRAQQVFLVTSSCCDDAYLEREDPALITVNLDSPGDSQVAALLALFPADRATTVFIVDPKGNLMMRYDAHAVPKGLHEDLQKLLNLSHIG
jgi:cytochrome oxidase Cu insertion factor (SCO1/SenC/PrrC family)